MGTPRSPAVAVALAMALLGACSSNSKSIIDAGNGAPPTVGSTVAPTTVSPTTVSPTTGGASTAPGATAGPTTAATTTTTSLADISALPACTPSALTGASGPIELTVWFGLSAGELSTTFQKLTAEYNASQSKVHVTSINQGGYEETIDKYLQSDRGSRPDVVQLPEYTVQSIVDTKSTVPVEACMRADSFDTSTFVPGALRAYRTEGVQRSMPFNVSDPVLFYNKKVFAAAGLDPNKPPQSLAEVRADSEKIVASGAAKFGLSVDSGFDSGGGWYIEQWFAQLGKFYSDHDNGRTGRATKVLYADDQAGADLLGQLQSMIKDGLAVDVGDNSGTGFDNLLKLADTKEPAAMSIATSASLGSVINILKGGQFPAISDGDVGVAAMPGPAGAKGAIVGGASLWIADSGKADRIAASWDYEKFMVGAQQQSEWSAASGYVAVRDDARQLDPLKSRLAADPRFAVALDQLLIAPDAPTSAGPILGPLREVRTATAAGVAKIFKGEDIKATLSAAAQQSDSLIAAYNAQNA